jgi:hypothetical protein
MRQPDEFPLDPDLLAELEAIDATLAGEPVAPRYAEIAELALIVAAERPAMRTEFAAELDARVEQRFRRGRAGTVSDDAGARSRSSGPGRWSGRVWWQAGGGLATALAATIALVIVFGSGSSSGPGQNVGVKVPALAAAPTATNAATATSTSSAASSSSGAAGAGTPRAAAGPVVAASAPVRHSAAAAPTKSQAPAAAVGTPPPLGSFSAAAGLPQGVQPQANGRRQIQSAQLALMATSSRLDDVAQEAFTVIGANRGIVNHSSVTAGGPGGYADIRISVPSQNLAQTMTQLSGLRYAHVLSRTDMSQDVNDRYLVDVRRLGDARAVRTSLLKQLAAASTQTQIDSLNAQIHDNELAIQSDEKTVASLSKQISFSQIELSISAGAVPVRNHHSGATGFTLHKAAHDAGRVLVIVAGVALIALAALVPIALVVALLAWIAYWLRRRGRQSALDAS